MVGRRTAAEHQIVRPVAPSYVGAFLLVSEENQYQRQDSTRKKASRYCKAFFVNGNFQICLKEISKKRLSFIFRW
jgi:hypothetical protein